MRSRAEGGSRSDAKNILAVRLAELDDEVLTELARLQTELLRKLERLVEDLQNSG